MRFLLDARSYDEMKARNDHTPDCYVRPGEYLHHMYVDGIKYAVARALYDCLKEAREQNDYEATRHLNMHKQQLDALVAEAQASGKLSGARVLGGDVPNDDGSAPSGNSYHPKVPTTIEETGLNRTQIQDQLLRVIYNRSRVTGMELAQEVRLFYSVVDPVITQMRNSEYIDIAGQRGFGDTNYEYILTPRGSQAAEDAMKKSNYSGPAPVPFEQFLESVKAQTIKNMVITRRNIRKAFSDLIITDQVLNEVGPAVNSGASIFLFGYPGNGKTSIAERITRLMGDDIFVPYAIDADGQIIKVYDSIVHTLVDKEANIGTSSYDLRWAKIKRPVVVVGGELTLEALDLTFNETGRFYEAPFQMKANGGIFLIDDFGRQQCRPMDLLNRWIVPLEKRYDYLTTITGQKIEVPFDQLLIFSTNLDPSQVADEAFLRRIKFKIEVRDPDESQWRQIWSLVCKGRKINLDPKGLDYLVEKWYKPDDRPFRMCQPRDILDQMISIAKYNMEQVTFNPDLIDAACGTYFVSKEAKNFGAKVRLD
ncbi:MAG: ATP-binding protein [Chloroflexi bacterium]|nr:ATP-binding protein [Chloroflexota bacterium]